MNSSAYSCTVGDFKCNPVGASKLFYMGTAFGYVF